ncbi:general secretion pathway protein D [Synechocystis sp. PCC 6803]|uniref:General secretion pathway protein D n=1 Tax=Synechocystis sp. (strain ATCC 27184 / PCC 6803 / Kazusa) TaxID=1111708 RepID=P74189_SYNY3|nr:general secretion pathway protein D [Synechocystis sp. PCC 6803]AVP89768.1 general secretion pathway protein GspD [Synechocystis sp. IPPAS B-1465]MBD2619211.1 type IV pilus secretin PilQ [Synechocystis sp. FACHB-898]MBD2639597.1 type IV pilus secretin PilQ [Synechocystis sp. FACHB-908]MBD2661806.1 type IV pilus secretin PilQ [Synechocystis sp. FACHB-929]BAL29450.1 general secretion pathway protein D [Synechocystis sp. PCC 6803 substr. GT-I]BAL32619.1 general secretion pathway protein D [Sy
MRSNSVKNFRFWLTTEIATCCLLALAPAQAETVSQSNTLDGDLRTAIAGDSSRDWLQFEKSLEQSLKQKEEIDSWKPSLELMQAKSLVKPGQKLTNIELLVQELEALSDPLALNFPEPNQTSVAQMAPPSRPMPPPPAGSGQVMFPNPEIIIQQQGGVPQRGASPQVGNPSILSPAVPVAPVRSRAVPPPVGDLAISNINASFDMIDLGQRGQVNVPSLVLREAPAREVLAVLTRYAGMNLIFTDNQNNEGTPTPGTPPGGQVAPPQAQSTITLDIQNESVQDVFNYVLMASGLKASRRGNTIFAGANLLPSARNIITRTIRLNQASAESVASTLASQGAEVNILFEGQEDVQLAENAPPRVIKQPPTLVPLTVQKPANDSSVLILEGLVVSTDPRLNTVTLVGEPRNVELASSMITQMDARRRQVAVNVKIIDINLNNIQDYDSSFSFGIGDSFFVQDSGSAVMRFGDTAPVQEIDINNNLGRITNPPAIVNPFQDGEIFFDLNRITNIEVPLGPGTIPINFFTSGSGAVSNNPLFNGVTEFPIVEVDEQGLLTITQPEFGLPSFYQYPKKFQAQIDAQIRSGNAKILTDPTLIVQEGEAAQVKLTESVIASVDTQVDTQGDTAVRTITPVLEDVGLTLNVIVDRIDDNGFITLRVNPIVASPAGTQVFDSGAGAINEITLINKRELTSGVVRLRDDQTFILSGIISELQRSTTSKVPILGDLPVIGALFRQSTDTTDRSEVIILMTPKIIHDSTEAQFGFRYNPDAATAEFLRQKGFPVQAQP